MEKRQLEKEKLLQQKKDLGLDPDEQEMNGLYGMAETKEEDAQKHPS
ncbi:DUF4021 domain-containing protein [Niallia sp. NCCP-28]|nr:DUF4021 domain-containing protein [Niallia sp. NCCP-28]GKU82742.1 hypothetical protein NCCP28_21380 [Niallia sp. NCCP-28]